MKYFGMGPIDCELETFPSGDRIVGCCLNFCLEGPIEGLRVRRVYPVQTSRVVVI